MAESTSSTFTEAAGVQAYQCPKRYLNFDSSRSSDVNSASLAGGVCTQETEGEGSGVQSPEEDAESPFRGHKNGPIAKGGLEGGNRINNKRVVGKTYVES